MRCTLSHANQHDSSEAFPLVPPHAGYYNDMLFNVQGPITQMTYLYTIETSSIIMICADYDLIGSLFIKCLTQSHYLIQCGLKISAFLWHYFHSKCSRHLS